MIEVISGPLVSQPETWCLVFDREASTWWASWMALGRYKHVRAFGYVPFLHVWVFFDPHLRGTDIIIAADGEPAQRLIGAWLDKADMVRMPARRQPCRRFALAGWCVPAVKRLIGLRSGALRVDALFADCIAHGGVPFRDGHGKPPAISATGA